MYGKLEHLCVAYRAAKITHFSHTVKKTFYYMPD